MGSFTPLALTRRVEPEEIGTDTWLIHSAQDALGQPLVVYLNAMVIKAKEPVIVDTNTIANRKQWMEDVFSLVDPVDVKWIYLSHDDVDHTGNLDEALEACPNATLVMSWPMHERHANAFEFPIERCRWLNDGESFDVGDRTLTAIRPPMYDSPTTRGLFDDKSGVYWGVDSFATPMMNEPVSNVSELDPEFWAQGMTMFMHNVLCPWISLVDEKKFGATCDRVQNLGAKTIATAHSPIINEDMADKAWEILRSIPSTPAPPCPDQNVLEAILSGQAPPA
jgi:flavorubredoxin